MLNKIPVARLIQWCWITHWLLGWFWHCHHVLEYSLLAKSGYFDHQHCLGFYLSLADIVSGIWPLRGTWNKLYMHLVFQLFSVIWYFSYIHIELLSINGCFPRMASSMNDYWMSKCRKKESITGLMALYPSNPSNLWNCVSHTLGGASC